MSDRIVNGGCHCGDIRYTVEGHVHGSMVCHCETCRRVSGAPMVGWVTVDSAHMLVQQGVPMRYHSSDGRLRQFCGGCGTQLTWSNEATPEEIDVATATLDDPEAYPPTHHDWTSHGVSWAPPPKDIPAYPTSKREADR